MHLRAVGFAYLQGWVRGFNDAIAASRRPRPANPTKRPPHPLDDGWRGAAVANFLPNRDRMALSGVALNGLHRSVVYTMSTGAAFSR